MSLSGYQSNHLHGVLMGQSMAVWSRHSWFVCCLSTPCFSGAEKAASLSDDFYQLQWPTDFAATNCDLWTDSVTGNCDCWIGWARSCRRTWSGPSLFAGPLHSPTFVSSAASACCQRRLSFDGWRRAYYLHSACLLLERLCLLDHLLPLNWSHRW